jgi:hypothetical protein
MSRPGKIRAVVVSLAVALVVLIPLCLRWQAQWQLSAYRKKLIAAGEKLSVEELAPKRNLQATNTALFLRLASSLRPFWQYQPSLMLDIKPGVARVAWREARLMREVDLKKPETNIWPALAGCVRTNEATLDELQKLVAEEGIEFIPDYTQPNFNDSAHLTGVRMLMLGLIPEATLALHQGQMEPAYRAIKSCGDVSQLLSRDPIMIDQLFTYAYLSLATAIYWEALQARDWTDDQLSRWQQQWEQVDGLATVESALAMERARAPMAYQIARASRQGFQSMSGNSGVKDNSEIWNDFLLHARSAPGELLTSYPRYWGWSWIWSYRDEQRYLEIVQTMIEAARDTRRLSLASSLLNDQNARTSQDASAVASFDLAGSMTGSMGRFVKTAKRAQTVANMVATALALERFRLARHGYPDALSKLVPKFMRTVPVDCMDGQNLRYRLNPDGTYLLYSVGEDGVDDGGDPTPIKDRSLSFFNGRDLVWPRAATAEEVQAYEAEQSKPAKRK